jgi:cell division protein FtsL
MMHIIVDGLLSTIVLTIFFGIIGIIFILGRFYECIIAEREIDEKIYDKTKELNEIKDEIAKLRSELQKSDDMRGEREDA